MSNLLEEVSIANPEKFEQVEFKASIDETLSPKILEVLKSFSIEGRITGVEAGPIVTSVYFDPAPGITISSIEARADDLQIKLGKKSLKISQAPEKQAIAIEVPNQQSCKIPFGNIFHSNHKGIELPAALGVDTKGNPIYLDITKTPHLLIAGQTGSGKSVCLNSIIASLALNCLPTDLQFLLIDPKRVEFLPYENMPNLISRHVIKDVDEAILSLKWLVQEMEFRNTILEKCRCKNIKDFKRKLNHGLIKGMPISYTQNIPYIVAIIDEFADLMMRSSKETTNYIMLLAQKARSVGIHLILATQRPSTKIISGDIKANFPTRIALKTATATDSTTILGFGGAEKLLGHGDMLLSDDGNFKRIHGCYISDEEIEKTISSLPNKTELRYNQKDLFTIGFQSCLNNGTNNSPTWGEINAVCKIIVENIEDYLNGNDISSKFDFDTDTLASIWHQLKEAKDNSETCEQISKNFIQGAGFAESEFIKFIVFTNFYFKDSTGKCPFLKYILEKAINENDKAAFNTAKHFCDATFYPIENAKDVIEKLNTPDVEKSENFIYLKNAVNKTFQDITQRTNESEQKTTQRNEFTNQRTVAEKSQSTTFKAPQTRATAKSASFSYSDSLTKIENIYIKKALDLFFEKGEIKQAYDYLEPIYKAHPSDEKVLDIFFPVLVQHDIDLAKRTLKSTKVNCVAKCIAEVEIAFLENQLDVVEKKIIPGRELWPNNEMLKCYEILWYIKLALISGEKIFVDDAENVARKLAQTDNLVEKTLQTRICDILSAITGKHNYISYLKRDLYKNLYSRNFGINEIMVGPKQIVKSIQSAIDFVDAGGVISVDAGLYIEHLNFSKSVKIVGTRNSIMNKASYELPIIVLNPAKTCEISTPVEIEGVIFTHNGNISFEKLDDYIHKKFELTTKGNHYLDNEDDGLDSLLWFESDSILNNVGILDSEKDGITFSSGNVQTSNSVISHCGGIYYGKESCAFVTNSKISYCSGHGIYATDQSRPQIKNCEIFGNAAYGIGETEQACGTYADCNIHNNTVCGIEIEDSASGTFSNCNIHNNTGCGIEIEDSASGTFSNCNIHDNKQNGLYFYGNAAPTVDKCKIHDNKTEGENYPGIVVAEQAKPKITNCEIFGHLSIGIWEREQACGTYTNCNIHNNTICGIRIQDSASGTFSNCNIHNNDRLGIFAYGNAIGTFKNCHIHDNKQNGLTFHGNAAPTVDKCKIHDNKKTEGKNYPGIIVAGQSKPKITNCEIFGHLSSGIWEKEQACGTYTDCNIHNNTRCGIRIQDSASGTFSNCNIHNNDFQGILAYGNAIGTFKNCHIHDNKGNGLHFYGNATPTVDKCKIHDNNTEDKTCPGIIVAGQSKPKITNCEIFGHLSSGIWEREQACGTYNDCNIHNNTGWGIKIQDSASGTFSNCNIHNNDCQGISAYGNAKGNVKNCHIHDNKRNGLFFYGNAAPIVDKCKIHDNKTEGENYPGIVVAEQAKPKITDCEISGHLSYGVWIKDNACGSYSNCYIHDNKMDGLKTESSTAHPQITNCQIYK